jgi:hypothetical protein
MFVTVSKIGGEVVAAWMHQPNSNSDEMLPVNIQSTVLGLHSAMQRERVALVDYQRARDNDNVQLDVATVRVYSDSKSVRPTRNNYLEYELWLTHKEVK